MSEDSKGVGELLVELINENNYLLAAGLLALLGVHVFTPWTLTIPRIPQIWTTAGITLGVCFLVGSLVGGDVVELLEDEEADHVIVCLGLSNSAPFAEYGLNDQAFEELTVVGARSLHQYEEAAVNVYEAVLYDPERHVAYANWRGALSEREQARTRSKVEYNTQVLSEQAQRGNLIEANAGPIVRQALAEYTSMLDRVVRGETLPDASLLNELMAEAVDSVEAIDLDAAPADDQRDQEESSGGRLEIDLPGVEDASSVDVATDGGQDGDDE